MLKKITAPIFLLLTINTFAADQLCDAHVRNIAVRDNGEVRLVTSLRNSYFTICTLDGSWKSIPADVCKLWLSQAQIAYTTDRMLRIHFPENTSCTTHNSGGGAPAPRWLISISK